MDVNNVNKASMVTQTDAENEFWAHSWHLMQTQMLNMQEHSKLLSMEPIFYAANTNTYADVTCEQGIILRISLTPRPPDTVTVTGSASIIKVH